LNKLFLAWLLTGVCFASSSGQNKLTPYGNNAAAGKFYSVRGIRMYVEVYGQGKPLLMIHGNGGDISAFSRNIPYFSRTYKVIVADSRAQGKSADGGDSLSFEMMADDFAALLDMMHIDSAYVIGWSDGGINALVLAMRHPGKVIKLVATGANITADSSAFIPSSWTGDRNKFETEKNKIRSTPAEKNDWKLFMLDLFQPNISFSALKAIQCPALIICGDHDLITIEHTAAIYKNIPRAYLWVLPNSGHGTLQDHQDEFNKMVNAFFKQPFGSFHY